jgi:hypothetical protein
MIQWISYDDHGNGAIKSLDVSKDQLGNPKRKVL